MLAWRCGSEGVLGAGQGAEQGRGCTLPDLEVLHVFGWMLDDVAKKEVEAITGEVVSHAMGTTSAASASAATGEKAAVAKAYAAKAKAKAKPKAKGKTSELFG